jgi:hypothetical protein
MGDKSQEKINVSPPPKTLFWTLFWGCDGGHRFLGVGGVGFGGVYEEILCQNHPKIHRLTFKISWQFCRGSPWQA